MTTTLRLYLANRRDQAYSLDAATIAERFGATRFYSNFQAGWPLDRAWRVFITASEPDGLGSTFEEDDYPAVFDVVLDHLRDLDPAQKARQP